METLIQLDKKLFLFLNGLHDPQFDRIFWYISETSTWIPIYLLFLITILHSQSAGFSKFSAKRLILVLLGTAVAITLADQITSGFMKPFFARLRPSHEPSLQGMVHLVADTFGNIYKGGRYGFASSHAANSFAVAALVSSLAYMGWVHRVAVLWAIAVSYSRIYLGVHYPGDIFVGAAIGWTVGSLVSRGYFRLIDSPRP